MILRMKNTAASIKGTQNIVNIVGVLALQGAFREHRQALERLGATVREVRLPEELDGLSALIIPGGESTTMIKLMAPYGFDKALPEFAKTGAAIWGTCAGAILIAKDIDGHPEQYSMSILDMTVARNAYGRQIASFETAIQSEELDDAFHAIFIRAPKILSVADDVEVVASYANNPIWVRKDKVMATVFHPELSGDDRIHAYFLNEVAGIQTDIKAQHEVIA